MSKAAMIFAAVVAVGMQAGAWAKPAAKGRHKVAPVAAAALDARQRALQALNRLAFGPRPGDVDAVARQGVGNWIDEQLHPERIDDSAVEAKLAKLPHLQYTPAQLMACYAGDLEQQKRIAMLRKQQKSSGEKAEVKPAVAVAVETPDRPLFESVQILGEVNDAKLLRAAESHRQLQEVLADFWANHFNLDAKKGPVRVLLLADQRDAVRPHVLGRFRDLIEASAKSPAMLFYLDNASSTRDFSDPNTAPPGAGRAARRAVKRGAGLNENYARELMELHTLGVDGGYTQKDVTEVARCFTGWGIDRQSGEFRFNAALHDYSEKHVLGHTIAAGRGIEDGEEVLDLLASQPATARFIARKLCVRLVSDTPPTGLVNRAAATFRATGGDLRAVVRTIVTSPEFFAPAVYRAKYKSPFEYAVSCVRALNGSVEPPDPTLERQRLLLVGDGAVSMGRGAKYGPKARSSLAAQIAVMGQPLYSHQQPNGYPEDSREWISSGGLLSRFNFAIALTEGRVTDAAVDASGVAPATGADTVAATARAIMGADLTPATRAALQKSLPVDPTPAQVAALLLGSPDFQRK